MNYSRMLLLLLPLAVVGCAAAPDGSAVRTPESKKTTPGPLSVASVADALRAAGLKVEDAGRVEQPFFGVPAHVFTVEGNDVQVYEFAGAAAAGKAAAQVAPNGGSIGTTMLSWMAPPHFFRKDRLIVNYIGTSETTLTALRNLLGPQFAGR